MQINATQHKSKPKLALKLKTEKRIRDKVGNMYDSFQHNSVMNVGHFTCIFFIRLRDEDDVKWSKNKQDFTYFLLVIKLKLPIDSLFTLSTILPFVEGRTVWLEKSNQGSIKPL